ncbi:hypothetical protein VNO77_21070 [Canavalia gladiata]|uniref:Uncharacterized protein n=1 Tax=Canavalia gladiata TaxID=3824 RepID=A0AAN9QR64_CANGL
MYLKALLGINVRESCLESEVYPDDGFLRKERISLSLASTPSLPFSILASSKFQIYFFIDLLANTKSLFAVD